MKNILVTGGSGFIGSHTCLALLEKGYRVFVIDSFENSSEKALLKVLEILKVRNLDFGERLKVFRCDIRNLESLENAFLEIIKNHKSIDGIIHFAGLKSVPESINYPLKYWEVNVSGTINLLETMQKYQCNTFVFSSSATIYEQTDNIKLSESFPLNPTNPYGTTKLTIEKLLQDLYNNSKIVKKFASLRYFNPIGAHNSGLIGEDPKGKTNNIFPLIINTAIGIQKVLEIYGNDWPTRDGTTVRDYIHVMDLAEAHIKTLENLMKGGSRYLIMNIGTGKGTSVLELLKTFEKVNNVKVPYIFSQRRKGDLGYVVADNYLIKSELNFIPKMTIEEMCVHGWEWKKLNPNGY